MPQGLTFNDLADANMARVPLFKNALGFPAHPMADGSDWSLSDWLGAVVGEVGEYANVMKKVRRGDFADDPDVGQAKLAQELADIDIYLSILYRRHGIDREQAIIDTWNAKNKALGIPLELFSGGHLHYAGTYEVVERQGEYGPVRVKVPTSLLTTADMEWLAAQDDGIPF